MTNSALAEHIWEEDHKIDWDKYVIVGNASNWRDRKTIASKVKYTAQLDPVVEKTFEEKASQKPRHHPGIRDVKCVPLPLRLEEAAYNILMKYETKILKTQSDTFIRHINRRLLPVDERQRRAKLEEMQREVIENENVQFEDIPDTAREQAEQRVKNKAWCKYKQVVYHWQPVAYNGFQVYLYLYGKVASNFAVLKKVFFEINSEIPDFTPKTVFDFGSGLGTVIWAANDAWGDNIGEYFCVDASDEMNSVARLLLQDGQENAKPFLKNVFFRQFLPASTNLKYDLVVCSWALLDLPSIQKRLEVIDNLWNRTQKVLVLIEYGSNAGYSAILEARDYILNKSLNTGVFSNSEGPIEAASVVCPCPHDLPCPRYMDNSGTPCNFTVKYKKLTLVANDIEATDQERFSYVVLQKEFRPSNAEHWPRITRDVLKRSGHVVCRMCCSSGSLAEVIFSKSKHSTNMYKCAKASEWGDLLPAKVFESPDDSNHTNEDENMLDGEEEIKS